MAVYKVIQDVEAEDKILGPLSLRQLIYAIVAVGIGFVAYRVFATTGSVFVFVPFLPFIVAFLALAAPLSPDQSTEMWLAARIRFLLKPQVKIWNQDGMKNLVEITAPKIDQKYYSDGLSQDQVHSRLKALSSTLDSRGWAVKNASVNTTVQPSQPSTDRLFNTSFLPQTVQENYNQQSDDILSNTNQESQRINTMVEESTQTHKDDVIKKMQAAAQLQSQPSTNVLLTTSSSTAGQPNSSDDEDTNLQQQIEDGIREKSPTTIVDNPADSSLNNPNTATPQAPTNARSASDYSQVQQQIPTNPKDLATISNASAIASNEYIVEPGQQPNDIATNNEVTAEEETVLEHLKEQKEIDKLQSPNNHHKSIKTPQQLKEEASKRKEVQRLLQEEEDAKTHMLKPDTIELAKAKELKVSTIAKLAKHHSDKKAKNNEVVVNLH